MQAVNLSRPQAAGPRSLQPSIPQGVLSEFLPRLTHASTSVPLSPGRVWVKVSQDICALFSPAWGAWTTLAGQQFSCDNSNTGSANAACGGGSCPFLQNIENGDFPFCGFNSSTSGTPNNCWGLGIFAFGQVFPFDNTAYFE